MNATFFPPLGYLKTRLLTEVTGCFPYQANITLILLERPSRASRNQILELNVLCKYILFLSF